MENHELIWGLPVIGYFFLAGLGAGALVTSATLLLRRAERQKYFPYARYGAILSVPTVAIGTALLVLELGSFEAGHWFQLSRRGLPLCCFMAGLSGFSQAWLTMYCKPKPMALPRAHRSTRS